MLIRMILFVQTAVFLSWLWRMVLTKGLSGDIVLNWERFFMENLRKSLLVLFHPFVNGGLRIMRHFVEGCHYDRTCCRSLPAQNKHVARTVKEVGSNSYQTGQILLLGCLPRPLD